MPLDIGELGGYYKDYLRKFYGGKSLLSDYEEEFFNQEQKAIDEQRAKLKARVMERLGEQGITASGIGSAELRELVDKPIESAEAALSFEKRGAMRSAKERIHGEGLAYALQKIKEEEAYRKEKGSLLGRVFGGGISGGILGATKGGAKGALLGALLGITGNVMPGGDKTTAGGGEDYSSYLQYYLALLEAGIDPEELEPGEA